MFHGRCGKMWELLWFLIGTLFASGFYIWMVRRVSFVVKTALDRMHDAEERLAASMGFSEERFQATFRGDTSDPKDMDTPNYFGVVLLLRSFERLMANAPNFLSGSVQLFGGKYEFILRHAKGKEVAVVLNEKDAKIAALEAEVARLAKKQA